ncbi:MAG: NADPH-dependent F420 reductase [Bacteroidia bacterium]
MNITILGTGSVGQTLAEKFISQGHTIIIGTRNVEETMAKTGPTSFSEWHSKNPAAQLKTFSDAAKEGELIVNALNGNATLTVFQALDAAHLEKKIVIDLSNPLDFSKGFPPTLLEGLNNSNSLGESIQQIHPQAHVVKTLNTMWCGFMLAPNLIQGGQHINFISGNDQKSKEVVTQLLITFGWTQETLLDLGDITNSRGTEGYLLLWTRIYAATKNGAFNLQLVK